MSKKYLQDYHNKFNLLTNLQPYVLVTSGGRSGTDFLQSLLEGHNEVLTFNGHVKLYSEFFEKSKCLLNKPIDLHDLAQEFYGLYIEKFKSRYDYIERKDKLGKNGNETLNIDSEIFIKNFVSLLNNQNYTKKNILMAIYAAYHESLGYDYINLKVLLYHAHHFDEVYKFLNDFPTGIIICTIRDPRAGLVSSIENWKKFDELSRPNNNFNHDSYIFYYYHLKRILEDEGLLVYGKNKHIVVKLEDLLNLNYMKKLGDMLKINYDVSMMESTFGGKLWYGDRISGSKIKSSEWSEGRTYNGWREKLSWREKKIINYIMYSKLKRNDYEHKEITIFGFLLVFFLAFIPFRYELRYLTIRYISAVIRKNKLRGFYYFLFTPFYFVKVRLIIFRYATIQVLTKYRIKHFKYIP
jgi:hypothetical protein